MHSMPVLSLVYFRNLALLSETCKAKCLDVSAPHVISASPHPRLLRRAYAIRIKKCEKWLHSKSTILGKDPRQAFDHMLIPRTLSGFLRCSQRSMVVVLKDRFTREIKSTVLPKRRDAPGQVNPEYQAKLVQLHGAILGVTAL